MHLNYIYFFFHHFLKFYSQTFQISFHGLITYEYNFFTQQLRWPSGITAQMAEWYRASVTRAVDSSLISSRVKPMTLKLVFTASLLDAQH